MEVVPITCPSCFEIFEVAPPGLDEVPCEFDYDCEVCCRPLLISFYEMDGIVVGEGKGLAE